MSADSGSTERKMIARRSIVLEFQYFQNLGMRNRFHRHIGLKKRLLMGEVCSSLAIVPVGADPSLHILKDLTTFLTGFHELIYMIWLLLHYYDRNKL